MNRSEIVKVRVTPEEKAAWEQQAAEKEMGVSELIRSRMNSHTIPVLPAQVVRTAITAPLEDVGTSEHAARGRENCPCGKPSFVYCSKCDD